MELDFLCDFRLTGRPSTLGQSSQTFAPGMRRRSPPKMTGSLIGRAEPRGNPDLAREQAASQASGQLVHIGLETALPRPPAARSLLLETKPDPQPSGGDTSPGR